MNKAFRRNPKLRSGRAFVFGEVHDRFKASDLDDLRMGSAGVPPAGSACVSHADSDLVMLRNTLARCLSRPRQKGEPSTLGAAL